MTNERQEHLAPVTYLFGRSTPEAQVPAASFVLAEPPAAETAAAVHPAAEPDAERQPAAPLVAEAGDLAALREAIAQVETAAPSAESTFFAEPQPKTARRAENVSMHALTKRGLSVAQMSDLLERRELEPDVVIAELERLESVGLLDDAALADSLVRSLHERKGLGRSAIVAELRRRKVDSSAIDEALEQLDGTDELAMATELAIKRAPQVRNLAPEAAKRRLSGFLMRRGYNGSVVSQAVAAALRPTTSQPARRGPRFE